MSTDNQIFPRELKINFNLRESRSKKPTMVYMVIYFNGKQKKISTGCKVYPNQWNFKKQEAYLLKGFAEQDKRNNDLLNRKIEEMKMEFYNYRKYICDNPDESNMEGKPITDYSFNFMMKPKKENKTNLKASIILKQLIENKDSRESSKEIYRNNLNKYVRWLEENGIEDSFKEGYCLASFKKYVDYLYNTEKKLPKTINNIFKGTLIALLKLADKDEDIDFDLNESKVLKLDLPKDKSDKNLANEKQVALTEEEVLRIYRTDINLDLMNRKRKYKSTTLDKFKEIKDMFVLQCLTGQRISDISKVINAQINPKTNTISIIQQKTNAEAIIPILGVAKEIIDRYKGKELAFYRSDNDAINNDLRRLLVIIGGFDKEITYQVNGKTLTDPLYKLVHTHSARHTFVTICRRRNISKDDVILATGHQDVEMINRVYEHLNSQDKAEKVALAFTGELHEEEPKIKKVYMEGPSHYFLVDINKEFEDKK